MPATVTERALLDGVIRGHGKERRRRLGPLNLGEIVGRLAEARIAANAPHDDLQLRRIPLLGGDRNGVGVADLPGRDRARIARALSADAVDRLSAKSSFFRVPLAISFCMRASNLLCSPPAGFGPPAGLGICSATLVSG